MAVTTRSTFIYDYLPGLFAIAVDAYDTFNQTVKRWDSIAVVKSSNKQYEEKAYRSVLGTLEEKKEGEPITYDAIIGGPKKRWVPQVKALGVRITEEAISDNLYEDWTDMFKELGTAAAEEPELRLARMFNNSTGTTYHTERDGSTALCSATHYRLDGSTFSNYATSSDLTYLTFWTNVILLENQYDDRQNRVRMELDGVLFPPQLLRKAIEIFQSVDRPDTGNRATNAVMKRYGAVKMLDWPYMTDTDMWCLLGKQRDIIWFKRWNTKFAKEGDFETGDIKCKVVRRDALEMGDPRGVYFVVP